MPDESLGGCDSVSLGLQGNTVRVWMIVSGLLCLTLFSSLMCVIIFSGDVVPPDTTLVFDIQLLDLWNKADLVITKTITTPKDCKRSVMRTDFVRYHFNGTLLDGTNFDSR